MNELALFAGAGGGILGGKILGWRTVCAVEWEPYPASVLCARQNEGFLPPFPIWDDVQTFDGRPWRGIAQVVSGGFPCQDISIAGKGDGLDGERSSMWNHMARVVSEVRPQFVFVENSPMLTSRGGTRVIGDLTKMGYHTAWTVMGAADVGAPHQRDRIWIVGKICDPDMHGQSAPKVRESLVEGSHRGSSWSEQTRQLEGSSDEHGKLERNQQNHVANPNSIHDALRGDGANNEEGMVERRIFVGGSLSNSGSGCQEISGQSSCNGNGSDSKRMGWQERATQQGTVREQNSTDFSGDLCETSSNEGKVSNTDGIGLQRSTDIQELEGKGGHQLQIEQPRDQGDMAQSEGSGLEGWDNARDFGPSLARFREGGWTKQRYWELEPDVGRVANGVALRVDRIKALGNGQVPLCAATAFRILSQML